MTMQAQLGEAIAPGTLISGRFEIESLATTVGSVRVWAAKDRKVARSAALWMISNHGLSDTQVEVARKSIRVASSLHHGDLVSPFGSAITADGSLCVATELVPSVSLAEVIEQKRAQGTPFTLSQVLPYLTSIAEALQGAVHPNHAHGAICPATIRFEGGRLRLAGIGMYLPLRAVGVIPPHYLAPELLAGGEPTPASDIYAVGALLYELLSLRPVDPAVRLSTLVPGAGASLDVLLDECLAAQPHERLDNLLALRAGLSSLIGPMADVLRDDGDIPVEFSERPPTMAGYTIPPSEFNTEARPVTLPPGVLVESNTIAPGHGPTAQRGAHAIAPSPVVSTPPGPDADLGTLLKVATKNDSDRWMFSHDGLDHGPLTARDLIAAIVRNEVMPDDPVTNMDTGDKRPLIEWPQYREFAETAADKRRVDARKVATQEAIADAGVARTSKLLIAGAAVVALALIGVVYYKTLGPGARRQRTAAEIDDLVQRGELRVQTQSIVLLPPPPPSERRHTGSSGHGGFTSYEAAMSAPVDYSFGSGGSAGGGTLSDAEITRPLMSNLSRFASCLDGSARNVTLRLAIGGNGRAIGVTVVNGSPGLKNCVTGVVRSLSWRAFGGPRIGLSWGFGV
jgi:hypothetical protein